MTRTIIESEKNTEYRLFTEMMLQSFCVEDVKGGINGSLELLRNFYESGPVAIFKKNEDGRYVYKRSDSNMIDYIKPTSCIINKIKPLVEAKQIFDLDLNLSERIKNILLMHIKARHEDYIVSVSNYNKDKVIDSNFLPLLQEVLFSIIERTAIHEENIRAISTDLLTGMNNRNSYERTLQKIEDGEDYGCTVLVFDINGLKPVNDKFGHNKGDQYITSVADIIKKYYEKERISINDNGIEEHTKTGHIPFRTGGDEFVVITKSEDPHLAAIKAEFIRTEVAMLNIGLGNDFTPGISCGIATHIKGTPIKEAIDEADARIMLQKNEWYEDHPQLNRRR